MKNNIVLIGMPGCGKTTIGKTLAETIKMEFIDVDEYIERTEKKSISDIFKNGEEAFRDVESTIVDELSNKDKIVISTGGGVIKRKENMVALSKNGVIIFINRPLGKIMGDVDTETRPLLKDGKEKLKKLYEERFELYKEYCDFEVFNDESIEKVIESISFELKKRGII